MGGALSQTYEPLEIVLSDDCSSDSTYDVMCRMASAYAGPHKVTVVRNPENFGTLGHALARGREASGDIVVVAAGDDISEPERTVQIVEAYVANPHAGCVSSWVTWIDENGESISAERQPRITRPRLVARTDQEQATAVIGCSAAYKKWVFDIPIDPRGNNYAEDMVFSFYIDLVGADAIVIDLPLVRYRMHSGAATNVVPNRADYERINYRVAKSRIRFFDECQRIAGATQYAYPLDGKELAKAQTAARDHVDWPLLSFSQRLQRVVCAVYRTDWSAATWGAMRLYRRYPHYQPILTLSSLKGKVGGLIVRIRSKFR